MPRNVEIVPPTGEVTGESLIRLTNEINKRFAEISSTLPNVSQNDFTEITSLIADLNSQVERIERLPQIIQAPADATALKNNLEQVIFPSIEQNLNRLQSLISLQTKALKLILRTLGR